MTVSALFLNIVSIASLALVGTSASAAPIYRWVDENGRTQLSDTVPEKYRKSAKQVDSEQFRVSPEARKSAEERAAKQKALASELDNRRTKEEASVASAASAASTPGSRKSAATSASDCATWRRLYRESQACFAPYHNSDGSLKPGAHDNCTQVDNPEIKCGVESWYQQ
jgi:hypothetical protein